MLFSRRLSRFLVPVVGGITGRAVFPVLLGVVPLKSYAGMTLLVRNSSLGKVSGSVGRSCV
jgi:hypothetical protein